MLKCYADAGVTNWASCLKHILYSNGFGYVWERQSVVNERKFIHVFKGLRTNIYNSGLQVFIET